MDKVPRLLKPGSFMQADPYMKPSLVLDTAMEVTIETSFVCEKSALGMPVIIDSYSITAQDEHGIIAKEHADIKSATTQEDILPHSDEENGKMSEQLKDTNIQLAQECAQLRETVSRLQKENTMLRNTNAKFAQLNRNLQKRNKHLECQISGLQGVSKSSCSANGDMRRTFAEAHEQFSNSQQELESCTHDGHVEQERDNTLQEHFMLPIFCQTWQHQTSFTCKYGHRPIIQASRSQ